MVDVKITSVGHRTAVGLISLLSETFRKTAAAPFVICPPLPVNLLWIHKQVARAGVHAAVSLTVFKCGSTVQCSVVNLV